MTEPAIRVQDLWKEFVIGSTRAQARSIGDGLRGLAKAPLRRLRHLQGRVDENKRFHALRGVSVDIQPGELVGLIGPNGAGKSTLLKVLSRITQPTRGRVEIRGRLSSLLEVGTGFHGELSGRENIYLNGAILGMPRSEVRRKFDDIVAFAETEKFLDTPVKRYSTGMYLRLAFAVAAHLDPEVLLVDEVLAVGDAVFQQRCIGRMKDVSATGRTVVFVSHDMGMIAQLCQRALWLEGGEIRMDGDVGSVIRAYLDSGGGGGQEFVPEDTEQPFQLRRVALLTASGKPASGPILAADGCQVLIAYTIRDRLKNQRLTVRIMDAEGRPVFYSASTDGTPAVDRRWTLGAFAEVCTIPGHLLMPGQYTVSVSHPDAKGRDFVHHGILHLDVSTQTSLAKRDRRPGTVAPLLHWETLEDHDPRRAQPAPAPESS